MSVTTLRAATRASALALRQTQIVSELLAETCGVTVEPVTVSTVGDRRSATPIQAMGGKGVFVKEVQAAVLDGRADIAVHSAKDLPSATPPGLVLAAVPRRGDARDALVGCTLTGLPIGATVATGSLRRRAQLAALRPDLAFAELRGNIATRLDRAGGFDAIVMAYVALNRLGLEPGEVDVLHPDVCVPQVGQGAIAVECRRDDQQTWRVLSALEHRPSRRAVDAERAFLAELGGDCSLPAGAYATEAAGVRLKLTGLLASPDGSAVVRATRELMDRDDESDEHDGPEALGRAVARHLLDNRGGRALLDRAR